MEKNLEDLRMRIEQKDKITDERIQSHLEKKERKLEEAKKKNQEKQNKIIKNLQINEEERNNEIDLIFMHQKNIEQNVILANLKKKEKLMLKSENLATKYALTMDNKKNLEEEKMKRAEEMKERQKEAEDRFEARKKEEEEILKQKKEERKIKDMEREMINERKKRILILEQEKKMEEIQEREKKIKEIKEQKNQLVREREKTQLKLNQQKENMLKRIEQIQKQNKEIDPETIKAIFPDDKSLFNEVVQLKQWQKEEEKRRKLDNYENEDVETKVNYNNTNFRYLTQLKADGNNDQSNANNKSVNYKTNTENQSEREVLKKKQTYLEEFNKQVREKNKGNIKIVLKPPSLL